MRTPSRIDTEFFAPGTPPFILQGGPDFEAEVSNVLEVGYRVQPTADSTFSATFFHSELDDLRSLSLIPTGLVFTNDVEGETTGVEAWGSYQPVDFWTLKAGMVFIDKNLRLESGGPVPPGVGPDGNDPHYQWSLRSWFDLPHDFKLDLHLRRTGSFPRPRLLATPTSTCAWPGCRAGMWNSPWSARTCCTTVTRNS